MRRLLSVLFLCGLVFSGQAYGMSESGKQKYLDWLKTIGGSDGALAVAPGGCWNASSSVTVQHAKRRALNKCRERCNRTCEIKDVNGTSRFIKKRGSSSSSTASSSDMVWCATRKTVTHTNPHFCSNWGGKAYSSKYQAEVEHKRLKGGSSSSSTASSSANHAYCYDSSRKIFYKSTRCSGPDKKISKREYTNRRLSSSSTTTTASSSLVWCATNKWWSYTQETTCRSVGGTMHSSKYLAQAAHKRLTGGSSSSSSSTASSSGFNLVWCATKNDYLYQKVSACKAQGGKSYSSMSLAKAEHKRLKAVSTPEVKTASLTIRSNVNGDSVYIDGEYRGSTRLDLKLSKGTHTIRIEKDGYETYEESINLTDNLIIRGHLIKVVDEPVQTVVVDNTAEIEFWKSVKDSTDPDMFREYLRQFPQGVYAGLAKLKVKKLGGDTTAVAQPSIPDLNYGDYYALVIGNNRYDHLGDLRTAVNDARSVANTLELDYGFNVTTLENANRDQIIKSISGLRGKVSSEDNVLIYYAGHGYLDEAADEGFWLPTDASPDDPSNWIMTDRIVSQVRAMKAKHVMIVADSCFSGTITRGIKIEQRTPEWLETIVKKKARTALTSGGLEPVMDSGSGNHSVFANSFLSILRENDGVLDASQLFSQLRPKVMVNSDQTPEYGDIHRAGHDGGDFLFVRQ